MKWPNLVCLLILTCSLSACCCTVSGRSDTPAQPTRQAQAPAQSATDQQVAAVLVGLWSTEGPHGTLIDPATGAARGSIYNGQWYIFDQDGTFRCISAGCGAVICGISVYDGNWQVQGNRILFTHCRETWFPGDERSTNKEAFEDEPRDDYQVVFGFDGPDVLKLDGDTYHRVVEQEAPGE